MKFAIHRSKHRLNRKFRKKWISIIPTVRDHSVVLFIYFFKQRAHVPFLWEEETCLPRKRAHVPRPLAHSACSPCPRPLTLHAHLSRAPFYSTDPLPHFFFFLKWTFSFYVTSASQIVVSFVIMRKKIFCRLRSFAYLWTLFFSLLLTLCFVWISFSHFYYYYF